MFDACWVLKWKDVNGKRVIHARLVVRGFKDTQATQLSTFAGTTSRWGQRVVNSVTAQNRWEIFTADVSQAFLRGLTFEQTAQMKDEVRRGSVHSATRQRGHAEEASRLRELQCHA